MFDDDFILFFIFFLGGVLVIYILNSDIDKHEQIRKDMLEKTEQYEKYDYCEKIDEKWYCFNEN